MGHGRGGRLANTFDMSSPNGSSTAAGIRISDARTLPDARVVPFVETPTDDDLRNIHRSQIALRSR